MWWQKCFFSTLVLDLRKWRLSEEYKEGTLNNHIPYVVEHHLHSLYAITQPACNTRLCTVKSGSQTFWPFPRICSPPSIINDHSLTYRSAERFWRGSKCVKVNVFAANGVAQRKMSLAQSSELDLRWKKSLFVFDTNVNTINPITIISLISKGFLKLNTVKTTDKKRRFDRSSVIVK